MKFVSVSEIAKKWDLSERSIRNYCALGKVDGAFLSTTVAGGFVGNVVGLYATSGNNR